MTRRRVTYIPERTGAGIVRLRKVELPATGIGAIPEMLAEMLARVDRQLTRLEQRRLARRPAPRAPR